MRRRLLIAAASMLCSGCDDVLFLGLGWGKGIIPQGAIRPRRQSRKESREGGEKGEEVRGFRSGGIWLPKGVVMGEHRMLEGATRTIGQILGPFRKEFVRRDVVPPGGVWIFMESTYVPHSYLSKPLR